MTSLLNALNGADWMSSGECLRTDGAGRPVHDPDLFFPATPHSPGIEEAKSACGRCPVADQCFVWGLDNVQEGIWGGVLMTSVRGARQIERYKDARERFVKTSRALIRRKRDAAVAGGCVPVGVVEGDRDRVWSQ